MVKPIPVGRPAVPRFVEHESIEVGIDAETLHRRPHPGHVTALRNGVVKPRRHLSDVALQHRVAAEVAQHAGDIRPAVEALSKSPQLRVVDIIVEQQCPVFRNATQIGTDYVGRPMLPVVIEEPAHLHPDALRVGLVERRVDMTGQHAQRVGRPTGWLHLVEAVETIQMVCAEHAALFIEKRLLQLVEARVGRRQEVRTICRPETTPLPDLGYPRLGVQPLVVEGHAAVEGRQHGPHAKLPLTLQYAPLQVGLSVNPRLRQRTLPTVDVEHTVPRKMGRPREEARQMAVGQPFASPNALPHSLGARDGQRHRHAVQCHPINQPLPVGPPPPRHGVAERTIVEEETLGHARPARHGAAHAGQLPRQHDGVYTPPRHLRQAIPTQVVVQPNGHDNGAAARDDDAPTLAPDGETLDRVGRQLEPEAVGMCGCDAAHQPAHHMARLTAVRPTATGKARQHEHEQIELHSFHNDMYYVGSRHVHGPRPPCASA